MSQFTTSRISGHQARYIEYVEAHPGCSVADVDRACRCNPRAGHRWVYDGVSRLVRRGLLRAVRVGARKCLFVPGADKAAVDAGIAG